MPVELWVGHQGGRVRPEVACTVRELLAVGASNAAIATELGCSVRSVKRVRAALKLSNPTPHAPVPDAVIRQLHAMGLPYVAIAAATGLTHRTVQQRAHMLSLRAHRGLRLPSRARIAKGVRPAGVHRVTRSGVVARQKRTPKDTTPIPR